MLDVQEQLLLDSLTAFDGLVTKTSSSSSSKGGNNVTWGAADCENYIRSLQEAMERLSAENRSVQFRLVESTVV